MTSIELEIHEDIVSAIEKLKLTKEAEVEFVIPEGSVLFDNVLNLKLLKKEVELAGKTIDFVTVDEFGQTLIDMLEGNGGSAMGDFVSQEVSLQQPKPIADKKKFKLPSFKFPALSFSFFKNIKLPKFGKLNILVILAILLVLGGAGWGLYQVFWKAPKADVKVVVNSQPLIKSVQVKVVDSVPRSIEERILPGSVAQVAVTKTASIDTTGELLVGERAQGKVKVVNRTTVEKEFSDGEEIYSKSDDDLYYTLDDDVTVPAATLQDPNDINSLLLPGSIEVNVTAVAIGDDYNLDAGEDLEFDDYSSTDYVAQVTEDIEGGSSEIVKTVVQTDLDTITTNVQAQLDETVPTALGGVVGSGELLIGGSEYASLASEEVSAELGDQVDKVELTRTITLQGLTYRQIDLEELLRDLLKDFVPDGFELSTEETETNVEVLGSTDATTLSLYEADLQVTLKSYVLPKVDEEGLKQKLVGKKVKEAEKIIGEVRNVKTYEININPKIPFVQMLPTNIENISLDVKRE